MKGFLSFRGYNRAAGADEFSKLTLVLFCGTAFFASLSILGVTHKLAFMKRLVPGPISRRFPSLKY
jgi:hypothetical protein